MENILGPHLHSMNMLCMTQFITKKGMYIITKLDMYSPTDFARSAKQMMKVVKTREDSQNYLLHYAHLNVFCILFV